MPHSRRNSDTYSYDGRRPYVDDVHTPRTSRSSRRYYDDAPKRYHDDSYTRRSKSSSRYSDDRRRSSRYEDSYYPPTTSSSSRRSRSVASDSVKQDKINQAVKAGIAAGAVEAFRQRKNRGDWTGEKGVRVATAAVSAAALDAMVDKDPGRKSKRHIGGATIGGLVIDRLLNGSSKR